MKNFDIDSLQVPGTIWGGREVGTNDDAKRHLATIFPDAQNLFDTPKPESLLERIMHIATNPGDLVLDIFAGSGTTAATAHKMGRRWIIAERLPETFETVLLPRLSRVVAGADPGGVTESTGWTGGGAFRVVNVPPTLGESSGTLVPFNLPEVIGATGGIAPLRSVPIRGLRSVKPVNDEDGLDLLSG
jgi:adenine-specific DNA-methyltransferase